MIFSEHFEAYECVLMIPKLLLNEKMTKTRPNLAKKHQKIPSFWLNLTVLFGLYNSMRDIPQVIHHLVII